MSELGRKKIHLLRKTGIVLPPKLSGWGKTGNLGHSWSQARPLRSLTLSVWPETLKAGMLLKVINSCDAPRCLAETLKVNDLELYMSQKKVCSMKTNCHQRIYTICLHLQEAYKCDTHTHTYTHIFVQQYTSRDDQETGHVPPKQNSVCNPDSLFKGNLHLQEWTLQHCGKGFL